MVVTLKGVTNVIVNFDGVYSILFVLSIKQNNSGREAVSMYRGDM